MRIEERRQKSYARNHGSSLLAIVVSSVRSFFRQFARLRCQLLLLGFYPPFQLLDILSRRQIFRFDSTLSQHLPDREVVLHVFAGDGAFALQIFLFHVVVGHFGCQILGGNRQCRQKIRKGTGILDSKAVLHFLRGIPTEERTKPLIGLLSIGTEDCKGNEMTKETFALLKEVKSIDFRGNVEGHDIFQGQTDVVVCDGFVGNVVLKTAESLVHSIKYFLKKECFKGIARIMGAILLKGAFKSLKQQLDPDIYGGAPLLGVPGAVIITHGSSTHKAIYHAVRVGANAARHDVSGLIAHDIEEYESTRKTL